MCCCVHGLGRDSASLRVERGILASAALHGVAEAVCNVHQARARAVGGGGSRACRAARAARPLHAPPWRRWLLTTGAAELGP